MKPTSKMSVLEASEALGVSPQFIRLALQQKAAPFGIAVKHAKQWTYHITRAGVEEYLGAQKKPDSEIAG